MISDTIPQPLRIWPEAKTEPAIPAPNGTTYRPYTLKELASKRRRAMRVLEAARSGSELEKKGIKVLAEIDHAVMIRQQGTGNNPLHQLPKKKQRQLGILPATTVNNQQVKI